LSRLPQTQLLVWSATGLFVAPIAGRLAGGYGNRPFMLAGVLMQTAGLACLRPATGQVSG
jgi:hypothetical protein